MKSSELKLKAKELLMGKKKNAAIMVLVMMIIVGLVSGVTNYLFPGEVVNSSLGFTTKTTSPVASLIQGVVSIFLALGMLSYFMKIARGQEPELKDLFSKGNLLLKAFITSILVAIFVFLGCIALIVPGILLAFGYTLINYLYIDNPEIGITEVMKKSREMMRGHKWEYFCLMFSFIGWILLTIPTFGLLAFWLIPYMGVTAVLFYDGIKG